MSSGTRRCSTIDVCASSCELASNSLRLRQYVNLVTLSGTYSERARRRSDDRPLLHMSMGMVPHTGSPGGWQRPMRGFRSLWGLQRYRLVSLGPPRAVWRRYFAGRAAYDSGCPFGQRQQPLPPSWPTSWRLAVHRVFILPHPRKCPPSCGKRRVTGNHSAFVFMLPGARLHGPRPRA
jgi:hypothetical protein